MAIGLGVVGSGAVGNLTRIHMTRPDVFTPKLAAMFHIGARTAHTGLQASDIPDLNFGCQWRFRRTDLSTNVHAREYKLVLPSKADLRRKLLEWTEDGP